MGIALVKAAYAAAAKHSLRAHAPMRVFVFMAMTALDDAPRPAYFGSRDSLADALAAPRTPSGHKLVKQAVATLASSGFVCLDIRPAPGRPGRYALLDGAGKPLTRIGAPSGSTDTSTGHPQGAVNNTEQGTLSNPTGHPQGAERGTLTVPPRRDEGTKEEEGTPFPRRICTLHPNWEHDKPCRACGNDRRAHDTWLANDTTRRQQLAGVTPPRLTALSASERALVDDAVRGIGLDTLPELLLPALAEAHEERERSAA